MNVNHQFASVYAAFEHSIDQFGPRPFLRAPAANTADSSAGAVEFSYDETSSRVQELIGGYAGRELKVGDRVAVAFDSRLEVYLHLLALNALSISIVPLNSAATDDELLRIVEHSDSRLIISLTEYAPRFKKLACKLVDCEVLTQAQLEGSQTATALPTSTNETEAALLYTSGTTGKPKGCMLSNDYFVSLGNWYVGLGGICALDENDRLLTPLPPNHMNALCTSFPAMMMSGGCVIQLDRFHPRAWWQTVREENVTVIHCLGVMTAILLTLPETEDDDFSAQVKFCFGPGSDPRHQRLFETRFGVPLIEAWAMTESGSGGMTIAYEEPRHIGQRCIGKPANVTEFRIVDDKERDVINGESGELLVRAKGDDPRKGFFSGYYKDPNATAEGWHGGWWHTGDVVKEGNDGSLFFVDRRKNVIRRSGENVAAVEVEAVLLGHPEVENAAVCAVPDEIRGDEVFAFVVSRKDADAKEIFDHCMRHLTYFKAPGYIANVQSLPLTASQKLRRGEIKQMARDAVAAGKCNDLREFKKRTKS